MSTSDWKHFADSPVTHSAAHYLMAIHLLRKEAGYARGTDIARHLSVSPPSVTVALDRLKIRGYVREDENKFYVLTPEGEQTVATILAHRRALQRFFADVLGVDPDIAEADACKIEHLISTQTGRGLIQCLNLLNSDHELHSALQRLQTLRAHSTCSFPSGCEICEEECILESR